MQQFVNGHITITMNSIVNTSIPAGFFKLVNTFISFSRAYGDCVAVMKLYDRHLRG